MWLKIFFKTEFQESTTAHLVKILENQEAILQRTAPAGPKENIVTLSNLIPGITLPIHTLDNFLSINAWLVSPDNFEILVSI